MVAETHTVRLRRNEEHMKRKLCLAANDSFGMSIPEQIALFGEIGFDAFFVRWSDQLGVWRDAADRVGLEFQSVHAQNDMTQFLWERSEGSEILVRDWIRCVEDCARIGVPIMVLHPFRGIGKEAEPTPQGVENFKHVVDAAVRHGIKLAVENCEGVQYLSALLNAFPDCENVAFCWDTGHEQCYNRGLDVMALHGERLICTHLNDNFGVTSPQGVITNKDDLHLLPFDGCVDWQGVAARLNAVGFGDTLSFELKRSARYAYLSAREYATEAYLRAQRLLELL